METLKLEPNHPAMKEFLTRSRRLKYDQYENTWYKIEWTDEALKLKQDYILNKKKEKYRETHPPKEKNELSQYLRSKMGLTKKRIKNENVKNE